MPYQTSTNPQEDVELADEYVYPSCTDGNASNGGTSREHGDGTAVGGAVVAARPGRGGEEERVVVGSGAAGASGERFFRSFSRPSRAVVTFSLFRLTATGTDVQGILPDVHLCDVEALEHNTLQQVMGRFLLGFCF